MSTPTQMPDTYAWSGLDAKGLTVEREAKANGESHVALLLKKQNIQVLKFAKCGAKGSAR